MARLGEPKQTILGEVRVSEMVFRDFLDKLIRDHFAPNNYRLLTNNCNSLTKILWRFLGNGDVPSELASVEWRSLKNPFPVVIGAIAAIAGGVYAFIAAAPLALLAGFAGSTSSTSSTSGTRRALRNGEENQGR